MGRNRALRWEMNQNRRRFDPKLSHPPKLWNYFTFPEPVAQVDDIAAKLREYADDVETTNSE